MNNRNDILQKLTQNYDKFKDLPFGVYIVDNISYSFPKIIEHNLYCEDLLGITKTQDYNIENYYLSPDIRLGFLKKIQNKNDNSWSSQISLPFYTNEKKRISNLIFKVQIFKDGSKIIGFLTFILFENNLQSFEDNKYRFPFGYFEIHKKSWVAFCNEKGREILELESDVQDFDILQREIISEKVFQQIDNLLEKSTEKYLEKVISAKVSGKVKILKVYLYRQHSNIPTTIDEVTLTSLNKVHTHIFVQDITFLSINEYSTTILIGPESENFSIYNFDENSVKWFGKDFNLGQSFLKKIDQDDRNNFRNFIKRKKDKCTISLNNINERFVCTSRSFDGYIILTLLVSLDKLNDRLDSWKEMMSGILHSYKNSFVFSKMVIQNVLKTHEGNGVKLKRDSYNEIEGLNIHIYEIEKNLVENSKNLISKIRKEEKLLSEIFIWANIKDSLEEIATILIRKENDSFGSFIPDIRNVVFELKEIIDPYLDKHRELPFVKDIKKHFTAIFRYSRLFSLDLIQKDFTEMIEETNSIDLIFHDVSNQERKTFNVLNEVIKVKSNLDSYGEFRGIRIELKLTDNLGISRKLNQNLNIEMHGEKVSFNTAFHNILHNAIKYSWIKNRRNVKINVILQEKDLSIEVINFGVGIMKEEIPLITQFGIRGSSSRDRQKKRPGSGIGLWYANEKIKELNGHLEIDSYPANRNYSGNFHNVLFKTIVTLKLPYQWHKLFG